MKGQQKIIMAYPTAQTCPFLDLATLLDSIKIFCHAKICENVRGFLAANLLTHKNGSDMMLFLSRLLLKF